MSDMYEYYNNNTSAAAAIERHITHTHIWVLFSF